MSISPSSSVTRQLTRQARLHLQRSHQVAQQSSFPVLRANCARTFTLRSFHNNHNDCLCIVPPVHPLLHTRCRFCSQAGHNSSPSSSHPLKPELISLDCIEVISTTVKTSSAPSTTTTTTTTGHATSFTAREVHASGPFSASPMAAAAATAVTATGDALTGTYCDVHTVDPFARGRVVNFIRRMGRVDGDIFTVKEIPQTGTAATGRPLPPLFVATCCVPLPPPHISHVAEGLAEDRKVAELLAAMHAERVCDALGVPLFRLKTAQQKHAETVRQEGRYAPMPGELVKPPGTPVPPPLRLLRTSPFSSDSSSTGQEEQFDASPPTGKTTDGPGAAAAATASTTENNLAYGGKQDSAFSDGAPNDGLNSAPASPSFTTKEGKKSSSFNPQGVSENHQSVSPASPIVEVNNAKKEPPLMWPTTETTTFLSSRPSFNETRRHDPRRLYAAYVPQFTDAEHAERVRSYASTVVYPWQSGWEGTMNTHSAPSLTQRGSGAMADDADVHRASVTVAAAAAAPADNANFDPTENGLWQIVNDRNLRRSPTPDDALVLPYVYDGPYALARLTEYYKQHNTTLEEHVKVRSVFTPGSSARMMEAELRLVGVSVTARGKSPTEEMAIRLAAMHAELLLDALGLPLFPKDAARQARHAAAVAGYGRWATNPLAGATTSPNPHDALPCPLKSQVGTDDIWLSSGATPQQRSRRTQSEHIIASHNFITAQSEDQIEVNPPVELLEEAYAMLREWQTHIARSRYTNLYVLFDMDSGVYRATTITPVPARFGLRGGTATAVSHEKAMQLCALHAMDTLTMLGVPLCVEAEQERRYLQRRAALGQVMPNALTGMTHLKGALMPHNASHAGRHSFMKLFKAGNFAEAKDNGEATAVPYLPGYYMEGQQTRLPPMFVDTVHAVQLRLPQDFCLFSNDDDAVLAGVGNEARTCVSNYIAHCLEMQIEKTMNMAAALGLQKPKYPAPLGADTAATREEPAKDEILNTHLWALRYLRNAPPSVFVTGYASQLSVHSVVYLQLPLPDRFALPTTPKQEKRKGEKTQVPTVASDAATETATAEVGDSADPLALNPKYVIAAGMSLKRKDATRACYIHAASILNALGVDVLTLFPRGTPRVRMAPNYATLEKLLGTEAVVIIPPFTLEGEPNTRPLNSLACVGVSAKAGNEADVHGGPRAVLHKVMKTFLEDPRHATPPKRRYAPGPNSPFMPTQRVRL